MYQHEVYSLFGNIPTLNKNIKIIPFNEYAATVNTVFVDNTAYRGNTAPSSKN